MSDIFISYARQTESQATRVADALRKAGYEVWLDDQLPAHRPYGDVIEERLAAAKAVVVVWSEAAARSQWVRSEANFAREADKLVQLSVDGSRLPLPFDQIQCADLSNWTGDVAAHGWRSVLSSVSALLGAAPTATVPQAPETAKEPSVAVLPFRDLSPGRDQDYFCEGAAEEIICALAELPGLRVTASTTALLFKDSAGDRDLGRLLNVEAFLEGSVRKSGDRVRVSVRLVNARQDVTLWAKIFERELSDIFAVQEEIARAIVQALDVTLLDTDEAKLRRRGTRNVQAYDLYLRGRQLMRRERETDRRTAAEFFRDAARLDPQFAQAYAGLADVQVELARSGAGDAAAAARTEALAASERAIALAPDLAEAHIAHGNALRLRNEPAAEAAFQRALALSPLSAELHYVWARFLVANDRRREAIVHYERAFELAPDDYRYIVMALQEYQALGDAAGERSCLERSWAAIERRLEIDPEDVRAYDHGAGVLALLGRKAEAKAFVDKALAFGRDDYNTLYTLACAAMLNGEPDQALDLLDRAVGPGRGDKAWLLGDHDLAPLHGDPRFEAILQRMA
jgi:adenylate cyclase